MPAAMISAFSLVMMTSTASAADVLGWSKGAGPLCVGAFNPCESATTCTAVLMGPCEDETTGASAYIGSTIAGIGWVNEDNYLNCPPGELCSVTVDPTGVGYRDLAADQELNGGKFAYSMSGNLFGETEGGYVGTASYFNSGSTNIVTSSIDVYTAHPSAADQTPRDESQIGAPNGPHTVCIADGSSGTCSGERIFAPGAILNSVFGYTYEMTPGQYNTQVQDGLDAGVLPDPTTHLGIRQIFQATGFDPSGLTFNGGSKTLNDLGTTDVTDISIPVTHEGVGYGHIKFKFPAKYNYGSTLSVSGQSTGTVEVTGAAPIKVKVSLNTDIARAINVDYLFSRDYMMTADKYFIYGAVITADLSSPPPPPSLIGWVKAAAGGMCVGGISECTDAATCTAVFIGPCETAEVGAEAFIAQSTVGVAFVDESSYLSCVEEAECASAAVIQATGPGYRDRSASQVAGDSTYAYTMAGNLFGTAFGAYLSVASYFNTGTSNIVTATNAVYTAHPGSAAQTPRGDSPIGAPHGPYDTCIADVSAEGTCVGTRTFGPGAYKFSIFGYTYEFGSSYETAYTQAVAAGFLPKQTTHMAVRTRLQAKGFDPSSITFNRGALTIDTLGSNDINDFTLTTPFGTINYTFPTSINYGTVATNDQPGSLDGSDNVKIRVSVAGEDELHVDYLVPVSGVGPDATLRKPNAWFMYDPDVRVEAVTLAPEERPGQLSATWSASGTVESVTELKKLAIRDAVAAVLQVSKSKVTITVSASSRRLSSESRRLSSTIVITALISTSNAADTIAKATLLSTNLKTADQATAAFAAASMRI